MKKFRILTVLLTIVNCFPFAYSIECLHIYPNCAYDIANAAINGDKAAIAELEGYAQSGDGMWAIFCAGLYSEGSFALRDCDKAIKYLEIAAQNDYKNMAYLKLADIYRGYEYTNKHGYDNPNSNIKYLELIREAAESGDFNAKMEYAKALDIIGRVAEAKKILEPISIEMHAVEALYLLYNMFDDGYDYNNEPNYQSAYLKQLQNRSYQNLHACYYLGLIYADKLSTKQQGLDCFMRVVRNTYGFVFPGNVARIKAAGILLTYNRNDDAAKSYVEKILRECDDKYAKFILGRFLFGSGRTKEGLKLIIEAANEGEIEAAYWVDDYQDDLRTKYMPNKNKWISDMIGYAKKFGYSREDEDEGGVD